MSKYLSVSGHQLGPLLPLGTFVSVVESCLIGRPAALLVAVPEGRHAHPFLQVCHPVHRQVDHSCQRTCKKQNMSVQNVCQLHINLTVRQKMTEIQICMNEFV